MFTRIGRFFKAVFNAILGEAEAQMPVSMLEQSVREMLDNLRVSAPSATALPGDAESIPMADETCDAIVCAQSFHWFANRAALAEIRRVLKPGGTLGLIWNIRDQSIADLATRDMGLTTGQRRGEDPRRPQCPPLSSGHRNRRHGGADDDHCRRRASIGKRQPRLWS